jgi:cell division protein FtsX
LAWARETESLWAEITQIVLTMAITMTAAITMLIHFTTRIR